MLILWLARFFTPDLDKAAIGEPDAQAKWYYEIKRLWQKSQQDKTPFVNPVKEQTLRWVT